MYLLECEGMQLGIESNRLLQQVVLPLNNRSFRIVQQQPAEPYAADPSPVTSALASVIAVFEHVVRTLESDGGYISSTEGVDAYSGALHNLLFLATNDADVQLWLDDVYMFGNTALYTDSLLGYYNVVYLVLLWAHEHNVLDAVLHRTMQHRHQDTTGNEVEQPEAMFCIVFIVLTFSASMEQVAHRPEIPWSWQEPLALQDWLDMMDRADIAERVREVSQQVQHGLRDEEL